MNGFKIFYFKLLLKLQRSLQEGLVNIRPHLESGLTLGFSRLLPVFVGLISFPLLTRSLGPEEYGRLALVISVVGVATIAAGTWMSSALHRYYFLEAQNNRQAALNRWIFTRALPASICASLLILSTTFLYYPVSISLIAAAFVFTVSQISYSTVLTVSQALLKFRSCLWSELLKGTIYVAFLVLFIYGLRLGVVGAIWAGVISGIAALLFLFRGGVILETCRSGDYWRKYLYYGMPMTISSIVSWILQLSDRWFLVAYHDAAIVGAYAANYSLIEFMVRNPLHIILLFLSLVLFRMPIVSEALGRLNALRVFFYAGSISAMVLAIVFGDTLLVLLASSGYRQDGGLQIALAIAQCVYLFAMYEGIALQLSHKTLPIMWASIIAATVNLILNVMLIPAQGAYGAAIATMVSYCVLTLFIFVARYIMISEQNAGHSHK